MKKKHVEEWFCFFHETMEIPEDIHENVRTVFYAGALAGLAFAERIQKDPKNPNILRMLFEIREEMEEWKAMERAREDQGRPH